MINTVPPLTPEAFARSFAEIHPPFAPQEAIVEANRCLFCFDAPCTNACPTHIDVPRFIKKISTANLRGAALTILEANILGLSCSRVCPVDVLCEGACVLHRYNKEPIEIGRLQRHAMDWFYAVGQPILAAAAFQAALPPVACIGAGPASLSCAAELRKRGFPVTIFDSRPQAGGLNTYGVAEYKFRPADSQKEVDLIQSLGAEFRLNTEIGTTIPLEDLEQNFAAIFIGVGLGPTQPLDIPGEELPGVIDALNFIADYKTTRTTRVGRRVAVIGGGNTAIDAATAARRLGAESVHMLYRRGESRMPAFAFEVDLARRDGISFRFHALPVAIHGATAVESIECVRLAPDLQPIARSNFRLPCDMVIVSIGQSKLLDLLSRCRGIQLHQGRVVADQRTGQTTNPRYFAGGDCVNGGREVVDAVAAGKRAAIGIATGLEQKHA
jgi:dihydropyrimidine dehydrogenase (NAD+) subunit PreT